MLDQCFHKLKRIEDKMGAEELRTCVWRVGDVMCELVQTVVISCDLRCRHMFPVWPPAAERPVC